MTCNDLQIATTLIILMMRLPQTSQTWLLSDCCKADISYLDVLLVSINSHPQVVGYWLISKNLFWFLGGPTMAWLFVCVVLLELRLCFLKIGGWLSFIGFSHGPFCAFMFLFISMEIALLIGHSE